VGRCRPSAGISQSAQISKARKTCWPCAVMQDYYPAPCPPSGGHVSESLERRHKPPDWTPEVPIIIHKTTKQADKQSMPPAANCLYCGRKLSLFKKLQNQPFCSEEHQSIHQRESDVLAIARLLQSASPEVSTTRKEPLKRKPPDPPVRRANTLLLTAGGDSGQELALTVRNPPRKTR